MGCKDHVRHRKKILRERKVTTAAKPFRYAFYPFVNAHVTILSLAHLASAPRSAPFIPLHCYPIHTLLDFGSVGKHANGEESSLSLDWHTLCSTTTWVQDGLGMGSVARARMQCSPNQIVCLRNNRPRNLSLAHPYFLASSNQSLADSQQIRLVSTPSSGCESFGNTNISTPSPWPLPFSA